MKPQSAAQLVSVAFHTLDPEAALVACAHAPWEFFDLPLVNNGWMPANAVYPLKLIISEIKSAKGARDGSLGEKRGPLLEVLKVLLDHGYVPKPVQVIELMQADSTMGKRVIAATVKSLQGEARANWATRLMAQPGLVLGLSEALIKAGVKPNEKTQAGLTPLMALWEGVAQNDTVPSWDKVEEYVEHTREWLDAGANPTLVGPSGKSVSELFAQLVEKGMKVSFLRRSGFEELGTQLAAACLADKTAQTDRPAQARPRI